MKRKHEGGKTSPAPIHIRSSLPSSGTLAGGIAFYPDLFEDPPVQVSLPTGSYMLSLINMRP